MEGRQIIAEKWYQYDENGTSIHYKNAKGYEYKYDNHGNEIYHMQPHGRELWREYTYDDKGNILHCVALESCREYDDANKLITINKRIKCEEWHEYDKNNNEVYYKRQRHTNEGDTYEIWYKYDEHNNLIYFEDTFGTKEWHEYDKNNNKIHTTVTEGKFLYEEFYEYDEKNNLIHYFKLH